MDAEQDKALFTAIEISVMVGFLFGNGCSTHVCCRYSYLTRLYFKGHRAYFSGGLHALDGSI